MPHAGLVSCALYAVPQLPEQLQTLGFEPGAVGYGSLKAKHGNGLAAPTVRTVQKMLHRGELAKWSICDSIIRLLNVARSAQQLPLLDQSLIEVHEYYLEDLPQALVAIRHRHGVRADAARAAIAERCDARVGLIVCLVKKLRTTQDQCERVQQAVLDLYGVKVRISNRPFSVATNPKQRQVKGRTRRAARPVPPLFR